MSKAASYAAQAVLPTDNCYFYHHQHHWGQRKRHRLWFSMKRRCYSMKTYVNSVILILKLNLTQMRNIYIKR